MASGGPHLQDLRRAIVRPNFQSDEHLTTTEIIQRSYRELAQEVVDLHNRFYVDQIAVGAGAGTLAVVLPNPYPDTNYSPLAILDWAAYARVSAIATTGFTFTFSAAAPGPGGGTVRMIVIR